MDYPDLEPQRLITSLSGIGLESSILFAQEGADVLLVDVNIEAAQRATEIINRKHPNAKVLATKADVGQEADVKAAVDTAIKEFGRLDIMVLSILLTITAMLNGRASSTTPASLPRGP
jgi:NAD(P)-dependent dehydrogenase (short-subunit alcohol dehydrogenase family)